MKYKVKDINVKRLKKYVGLKANERHRSWDLFL